MESFLYQREEFVVCVFILIIWIRCELSMLHIEDKLWNFYAIWVLQHASQSNFQLVFLRLEACVSPLFCKNPVTSCYAQKWVYSSIQKVWSSVIWHSALTDIAVRHGAHTCTGSKIHCSVYLMEIYFLK